MKEKANIRHYFVDEAGDLTFFDKKGRIIVGKPGASKFFMVGIAQICQPEQVILELAELRTQLCNDPRFKDIPSMQPSAKKTAITFHAKDDHHDVRLEVFKLMQTFDVKIFVAIRCKAELALVTQKTYEALSKKINQDDIYDDLVKRLFKDRLHKASANHIVFARRGKTAREEALQQAINQAKKNFETKWQICCDSQTIIKPAYPSEFAGLQVVDYYLCALQRLL
ncbi:DUF3800 domain-containing protein [Nostoc sp. ChiSLP03a]|uniref:DUF3800 domain-containing protein n=1 Tax=Nostoc sp. ChiSLP03a TaxID=3075380 RepID=UPI002AD353EC|nr:DUF3800 domain-containing protein [Nostoc sp. ChiSLP03a]MDZ8215631.1 DUF3800 domain-containing protein [Nostoc sp. ChiSLP03a]